MTVRPSIRSWRTARSTRIWRKTSAARARSRWRRSCVGSLAPSLTTSGQSQTLSRTANTLFSSGRGKGLTPGLIRRASKSRVIQRLVGGALSLRSTTVESNASAIITTTPASSDKARLLFPEAFAGKQERSEEHTSELQSLAYLVCRLLLEKKNKNIANYFINITLTYHFRLPSRTAH